MKVLGADDDPVTRLLLAASLREAGHQVTVTDDGQQAWDALALEHFSVLVSDWMMPRLDGLELRRRLRREPRPAYTYVILVAMRSGKSSFLECMEAGVDDFLTKPVDPDELKARLGVAERILGLRDEVPDCFETRVRPELARWKRERGEPPP